MLNYEQIIEILRDVARHPGSQVKEFKNRTGSKAVGCFPVYTPEEIVHAAGMLPVGLWGGQVAIDEAKAYVPAFTCSIMQSCLEYSLNGTYDELSAVIVPSMCDTLKCIGQNVKVGAPQLRHVQFTHPQMRQIESGVEFLRSEYERILEVMEEVSGRKITEEALCNSIEVFNTHRALMRRFTELAADHGDIITPVIRHAVIKSGFFMEKERHSALVGELNQQLASITKVAGGKRVLLSGIMAEPDGLLEIFEANGMTVVADDLAQETRQFRNDVPSEGNNALHRLAKWWATFEGCSLAYDPDKKRFDMILDDVKKHSASGVVVCMMKFCDPEEYDYPLLKKSLEAVNIPMLYIEIDQQAELNEQARTRIQGFAEILNN